MEIKLNTKTVVGGIIILAILAIVVGEIWVSVIASQDPNGPSPFSAVYLASGDIYYGKLSWFPTPHMTDVWYLQRGANAQGQAQLAVAPFKGAFWGPIDEININPNQILFTTRLSNGSALVSALENPQSAGQPQQQPSGSSSGTESQPSPSSTPSATTSASK